MSQNAVRYLDPVTDPFFSAARRLNLTDSNASPEYFSNYAINSMICADQYNMCNPMTNECTGFVGQVHLQLKGNSLSFNDAQMATAMRFRIALSSIGTWNSVFALGSSCEFTFSSTETGRWAINSS